MILRWNSKLDPDRHALNVAKTMNFCSHTTGRLRKDQEFTRISLYWSHAQDSSNQHVIDFQAKVTVVPIQAQGWNISNNSAISFLRRSGNFNPTRL